MSQHPIRRFGWTHFRVSGLIGKTARTMIRNSLVVLGAVICGIIVGAQQGAAQSLFTDNFDEDHSFNWVTHVAGVGSHNVDYFFDYSTIGIPPAPRSVGGTTRGMRLQANTDPAIQPDTGVVSGISVSPFGGDFAGSIRLRFDMWLNFHGPLDLGGPGTTQITGAGVGTAGGNLQIAGRTPDSVYFGATGDGGSTADYRAYSPFSGAIGYQDDSGIFAAPDTVGGIRARNNTNAYYSGFGGETAPVAQAALFPEQTLATSPGAQGFAWRDVVIEWLDTTITFSIDSVLIATVDTNTFSGVGGTNILFNQFDINNTAAPSTTNANSLLFGLIDNVLVEQIPEPTCTAAIAAGLMVSFARRRRK
jgi:hypothetical protein